MEAFLHIHHNNVPISFIYTAFQPFLFNNLTKFDHFIFKSRQMRLRFPFVVKERDGCKYLQL